ncbi:hypothetical protein BJ546DRAFT_147234 [Cryomyces antarcticus]
MRNVSQVTRLADAIQGKTLNKALMIYCTDRRGDQATTDHPARTGVALLRERVLSVGSRQGGEGKFTSSYSSRPLSPVLPCSRHSLDTFVCQTCGAFASLRGEHIPCVSNALRDLARTPTPTLHSRSSCFPCCTFRSNVKMAITLKRVAVLLLSMSSFAIAMPEDGKRPKSSRHTFSTVDTCPASTLFTTIYVISTTHVTTVTDYATFPTVYTLPRSCPTVYTEVPGTSCVFDTSTCITLDCISLATITAVCQTSTDRCCKKTTTSTLYRDCPRSCPTGCATGYTTITPPCQTPAKATLVSAKNEIDG